MIAVKRWFVELREDVPWYPVFVVLCAMLVRAVSGISLLGATPVGTLIGLGCWLLYTVAFVLAWRNRALFARYLPYLASVLVVIVLANRVATHARPHNPNILATWLLLTVPFGYKWGWRWLWWGVFGLLFTGSRGAMIGLTLAVVVMLIWYPGEDGRLRSRITGWSWIAVVMVAVMVLWLLVVLRPGTVTRVRIPEFVEAARAFWKYPFLGSGPWTHRVDSLPLTVAVEYGIPGLFAWAWLVVSIVYRVLTTRGNPARLASLAWLFHQLVDNTIWELGSTVTAFVVLALLFGGGEDVKSADCGSDGSAVAVDLVGPVSVGGRE
ncbi:MAG: hypothetical protein JXA33_10915 [Anaerolineae bacterium]|nr:hypothetical protein [Anaerolineae bacterium]